MDSRVETLEGHDTEQRSGSENKGFLELRREHAGATRRCKVWPARALTIS